MTPTTARQAVATLRSQPSLARGHDERFSGYGVMGMPFASGHYLALRDMVASSVGPAYRAIWHRDPSGHWTIHTTGSPELTCPRYFGAATAVAQVPSIEVGWHDDRSIHVSLGDDLDWRIELESTPATRMMTTMASSLPQAAWNSDGVLAAMGPMARVLRSGRILLRGATPNGPRFKAAPVKVWRAGGRASYRGVDLGAPAPLRQQTRLGDFWLPQRGLFFVGSARFSVADEPMIRRARSEGVRMGQ